VSSAPDSSRFGVVAALWRYPVKSMQGESLRGAEVTERGIPGDRAYALVETATGKIASAKNPRKWGALLEWTATLLEEPRPGGPPPPVKIAFPSGREVRSTDKDLDAVLSAEIGVGVSLRSTPGAAPVIEESPLELASAARNTSAKDEPLALGAPAGTFFDFAPIHLVTDDTLERLRHAYPAGRFQVSRFRPNVVVTTGGATRPRSDLEAAPEHAWIGTTLSAGHALRLNVVMPTPRCVMTTLAHGAVPQDPAILRTIAEHSRAMIAPLRKEMPSVGVYALIERPGTLRVGDSLVADKTTLLRKSAFWWTMVRNLARRGLSRRKTAALS
jgi:uncharacterized protein YcbX